MRNIVIYSKDNCTFCVQAKKLLDIRDLEYEEIKIGYDISREDFINKFPDVKTVPLIFIDDEKIGGFRELSKFLVKET